MTDDVEQPLTAGEKIGVMRSQLLQQAQTIATLRADLAKAVEGLERIEAYTRANITGMDHWNIVKETAIIKELRP